MHEIAMNFLKCVSSSVALVYLYRTCLIITYALPILQSHLSELLNYERVRGVADFFFHKLQNGVFCYAHLYNVYKSRQPRV